MKVWSCSRGEKCTDCDVNRSEELCVGLDWPQGSECCRARDGNSAGDDVARDQSESFDLF